MTEKQNEERPKVYGILEENFDMHSNTTKRLIKDGYVIIRDRGRVYAVKDEKEKDDAEK